MVFISGSLTKKHWSTELSFLLFLFLKVMLVFTGSISGTWHHTAKTTQNMLSLGVFLGVLEGWQLQKIQSGTAGKYL